MKLNLAKADMYTSTNIGGITYKYGWYHSGRAFIAKEDDVMTFKEAYKELAPQSRYVYNERFYCKESGQYYKKTIDGIVRYLIEKYNKD